MPSSSILNDPLQLTRIQEGPKKGHLVILYSVFYHFQDNCYTDLLSCNIYLRICEVSKSINIQPLYCLSQP